MYFPFSFDFDFKYTEEEKKQVDKILKEYIDTEEENIKRKDYCYDCNSSDLYCHAMTFKCEKCNKIILGG